MGGWDGSIFGETKVAVFLVSLICTELLMFFFLSPPKTLLTLNQYVRPSVLKGPRLLYSSILRTD